MVHVSERVHVNESRWFDTHTSRHDQYPFSAGLPELPVCSGLWNPGISPAAGPCLRKARSEEQNLCFIKANSFSFAVH